MYKKTPHLLFILSLISLVIYTWTALTGHHYAGWVLIFFFVFLALAFRGYELLKGYSFTVIVLAVVSLSMYYPEYLISIGDFKLSKLIIPSLQTIMFAMGTTLSLNDFKGVLKMPKGVMVGVISQFSIMPFVGFAIARIFDFPAEIAAGIILIGSCPSGLASNVMAFLARANLALSVTLTAVATMLAPLFTPFYMQFLAGEFVTVNFWSMMWDIFKVVIVPVTAGLLFHHFLHGKFKWLDSAMPLLSMIGIVLIIGIVTAAGRNDLLVVGPILILAVLLHNLTGYFLGYGFSRLMRMPEKDCRTVALEVGMQNGGLGSALALAMGKLSTVGLAPAVFASLMNITGSSLALWWRNRSLPEEEHEKEMKDQAIMKVGL